MHAEALPGIMLIIGDKREICLVSAEPGRTITESKTTTKTQVLAGGLQKERIIRPAGTPR